MLHGVLGGEAFMLPTQLGTEPPERDEEPVRASSLMADVVDKERRASDVAGLTAQLCRFDALS